MIIFSGADDALVHECEQENETCKVVLEDPECHEVGIQVDKCVAEDLKRLWAAGIKTICSCCGHGALPAFICIQVEDREQALQMGYTEIPYRYDHCAKCGVFIASKGRCE